MEYAHSTSPSRPNAAAYQRLQRLQSGASPRVRIVVCCDGTGNTPSDRTNVRRIWECLLGEKVDGALPEHYPGRRSTNPWLATPDHVDVQTPWLDGHRQICYYQSGISELVQQALGDEIHDKISEAYRFISENWIHDGAEGNEIVLIGFSRGAFACQCLANFLALHGVMELVDWEPNFSEIYYEWLEMQEQHFPNGFQKDPSLASQIQTRAKSPATSTAPRPFARSQRVKVCALFDSVAGLDTQFYALAGAFLGARGDHLTFVHNHLPANVDNAYHALSINEHRQAFRPVLWASPLQHQTLVQTWFPGFHCDIGGGANNKSIIPDLTLIWMVNHLFQQVKLHVRQMEASCMQTTTALGKVKDSRTLMYQLFKTEERFAYLNTLVGNQPFSTPADAPTLENPPNYGGYIPGLTEEEWRDAVTRKQYEPERFHWSVDRCREIIRARTKSKAFAGMRRYHAESSWWWTSPMREGKIYQEVIPNWLEDRLGASSRD